MAEQNIYIDANAGVGGAGTIINPYGFFSDLLPLWSSLGASAAAGNDVYIRCKNIFNEYFKLSVNGTLANPINVLPYGDILSIDISGGTDPQEIRNPGFSHFRISGFELNGGVDYNIFVFNDVENGIFSDIIAKNAEIDSFHIYQASDKILKDVTIDGCIISNCGRSGARIYNTSSSEMENVNIKNCQLSNCVSSAISYKGDGSSDGSLDIKGCSISNNEITGSGDGIYLIYCRGSDVSGNKVVGSRGVLNGAAGGEGYGIACTNSRNIEIEKNLLDNNGTDGIELWSGSFLEFTNNSSGCSIRNNRCINHNVKAGATGIQVRKDGTDNTKIEGNLSIGNLVGLHIGGDSTGCTMHNNTVTENDTTGLYLEGSCSGWTSQNNLFANNGTYDLQTEDISGVSLIHSYNMYGSDSASVVIYNGVEYTSSTITTFEPTSLSSDPLVLPSGKIKKTSPCNNTGIEIVGLNDGTQTDIFGHMCYGPASIGADWAAGIPSTGQPKQLSIGGKRTFR